MRASMKFFSVLAACAVAAVMALAAGAEDVDSGRYSMSPVEGGQLRLDRQTGAVALCAKKGETWSCEPVADKAKVTEDRLKALEDENKRLKDRVTELEAGKGTGAGDKGAEAGPPGGTVQIPSEEDVDKALDYAERIFKKFRDRIKNLDKPAPDAKPDAKPGEGGQL